MKNVIKRSLSFLLAITLVFSSAYVGLSEVDFDSIFAVKAEAASSGKCGKNLTWTLDNNGTLTISGKGEMYDYYHQEGKYTPWCDMASYIVTVVIKKGVTSIGCCAFSNCGNLTSVSIPDGITIIGDYAFNGCVSLASVSIPYGVTSIGREAFNYCRSITSITIPDSVTFINGFAFGNCASLESITIPDSVTDMIGFTFVECTSLTYAKIGKGLKRIAGYAFNGCKNLKSVAIPASVKEIEDSAFNACSNLEFVFYGGTQKQWSNVGIDINNTSIRNANVHFNATGHTNKTTTTKATLTTNGNVVTKCSVCGNVEKTIIYYPKTIKLSSSTVTYNGKVRTPSVIVKDSKGKTLVKGTDYKVTIPSGRKLPGIYKYTITFMGKYSGTKTLTFKILPATVNASKMTAVSATSAIRLTWPKVAGATGYKVYQYNASQKKYVQIATVTDATYKRTNLTPGATYYFKVKAYKRLSNGTVIDGAASNTYTTATQCAATKITSAAQTTSAIRIYWQKVAGASGYRVYQYSASQGKYVQIAVVSGTTYKVTKNLKAGTTYKFIVKPYKKLSNGTIINGVSSAAFTTATKCAAPTITSLVASSGQKATLKWSAVTGATGYQVYYSTNNSDYKKVVTTTSRATSKTFSKSAKGKKIYFKVRAYKKVNGQTIYGNWSTVKSVKLK